MDGGSPDQWEYGDRVFISAAELLASDVPNWATVRRYRWRQGRRKYIGDWQVGDLRKRARRKRFLVKAAREQGEK